MHLFDQIAAFFAGHVVPFLKNIGKAVVKAEIDALHPIATKLVAAAEGAVVSAAASGSLTQLGAVLAGLLKDTAAEAESSAVSAGATSLLAAIGTALATNTTTATSLAPAPTTQAATEHSGS